IDGDAELAAEVGLSHTRGPIWICGSTGPGEEALILPIYRRLLADYPSLQLAIIPRKPERFDEVAAMIEQAGFTCVRRSKTAGTEEAVGNEDSSVAHVVLGDTMGELRKFYSLADVVFVGRTL